MIRQCCDCKRVWENGRWVRPRREHLESENITHGYCDECSQNFARSVAEYVATMHPELGFSVG